jgi:predicted site-specific integrase-resolvase
MRFGAELVFSLCETFNTEVIIINRSMETSPEEDLVQDVLEIITVFSARLYGLHSYQNKVLVDELEKTAKRIQAHSDIDK